MLNEIRKFIIASTDTENHGDEKLVAFITGEGANGWYRFVNDAGLAVDKPKIFKARFTNGYWVQTAASSDDEPTPTWAGSTAYVAGESVLFADVGFVCLTDHTSDLSFVTDLNAGNWAPAELDGVVSKATLTSVSQIPAGTPVNAKLDVEANSSTSVIGEPAVATHTYTRTDLDFAYLSEMKAAGFRIYHNSSDITDLITKHASGYDLLPHDVVKDDTITAVARGANKSVGGATIVEQPSTAEIVEVSDTSVTLDPTMNGKLIRMTAAAPSVSLSTDAGMVPGVTFTLLSVNAGTIVPGSNTVGIGSSALNIGASSAVTVIVTANDGMNVTFDVIGGLA